MKLLKYGPCEAQREKPRILSNLKYAQCKLNNLKCYIKIIYGNVKIFNKISILLDFCRRRLSARGVLLARGVPGPLRQERPPGAVAHRLLRSAAEPVRG